MNSLADSPCNELVYGNEDVEIIKYLREQKHDFMNDIQVIWGYLQLNKSNKAVQYINTMNRRMDVLSQIFKIENPGLSLYFYNIIRRANKSGINIDFESESQYIVLCPFKPNINIFSKLDELASIIINKTIARGGENEIFIDIFDNCGKFNIVLSNDRCFEDGDLDENEIPSSEKDILSIIHNCSHLGFSIYCKVDKYNMSIRAILDVEEAV